MEWFSWENLNRKPMGFYHHIYCRGFRLKFSHDPILSYRCLLGDWSKASGWWLTYPSEKYIGQLGWLFPIYYGKNEKSSKPPTRLYIIWYNQYEWLWIESGSKAEFSSAHGFWPTAKSKAIWDSAPPCCVNLFPDFWRQREPEWWRCKLQTLQERCGCVWK